MPEKEQKKEWKRPEPEFVLSRVEDTLMKRLEDRSDSETAFMDPIHKKEGIGANILEEFNRRREEFSKKLKNVSIEGAIKELNEAHGEGDKLRFLILAQFLRNSFSGKYSADKPTGFGYGIGTKELASLRPLLNPEKMEKNPLLFIKTLSIFKTGLLSKEASSQLQDMLINYIERLNEKDKKEGLSVIESSMLRQFLQTIPSTHGWEEVVEPILPGIIERNIEPGKYEHLVNSALGEAQRSPPLARKILTPGSPLVEKILAHASPKVIATALNTLKYSPEALQSVLNSREVTERLFNHEDPDVLLALSIGLRDAGLKPQKDISLWKNSLEHKDPRVAPTALVFLQESPDVFRALLESETGRKLFKSEDSSVLKSLLVGIQKTGVKPPEDPELWENSLKHGDPSVVSTALVSLRKSHHTIQKIVDSDLGRQLLNHKDPTVRLSLILTADEANVRMPEDTEVWVNLLKDPDWRVVSSTFNLLAKVPLKFKEILDSEFGKGLFKHENAKVIQSLLLNADKAKVKIPEDIEIWENVLKHQNPELTSSAIFNMRKSPDLFQSILNRHSGKALFRIKNQKILMTLLLGIQETGVKPPEDPELWRVSLHSRYRKLVLTALHTLKKSPDVFQKVLDSDVGKKLLERKEPSVIGVLNQAIKDAGVKKPIIKKKVQESEERKRTVKELSERELVKLIKKSKISDKTPNRVGLFVKLCTSAVRQGNKKDANKFAKAIIELLNKYAGEIGEPSTNKDLIEEYKKQVDKILHIPSRITRGEGSMAAFTPEVMDIFSFHAQVSGAGKRFENKQAQRKER